MKDHKKGNYVGRLRCRRINSKVNDGNLTTVCRFVNQFVCSLYFQTEMSCCRRIVQLCRDCLLIVYQFAADAKAAGAASNLSQGSTLQDSDMRSVMKYFARTHNSV